MEADPGPFGDDIEHKNSSGNRSAVSSKSKDFYKELELLVEDALDNDLLEEDVDDSDIDPDYVYESDHNSESEQSDTEVTNVVNQRQQLNRNDPSTLLTVNNIEEVNNDIIGLDHLQTTPENREQRIRGDGTYFYGRATQVMRKKNIPAFRWKKEAPNQAIRTRQENIITQLPGLKPLAKTLGTAPEPESIWNLLISDDILNLIITWTNAKISLVRVRYFKPTSYIHDLDIVELKSFIGLLIYTAVFKSGHESASSIWATDGTGREIFRLVMTKERFLFLLQVLRFDDPATRAERKEENKEAAIYEIFQRFIENSQALYSIGSSATIDEMLVAFRGRSAFKMYIPNKPAKYGLKIQCLTDAKTHYLFNAYIYTGKDSDGKGFTEEEKKTFLIPTQAVLRLVRPIENSRRNITADNWYSSIQLGEELLKKGLTFLGTIKKNKNEIPLVFLPHREKEENSAMYGYTENLTLLSYVPKKSKAVLVISSMHHGPGVDDITGKPEMIAEYNRTKGGVDSVDQMCSNYSTSRRTQRWPMAVFFALINISAGVNSFVLHMSYKDTPKMTRIEFMKKLAKSLVSPAMHRRLARSRINEEMKLGIKRVLQIEENPTEVMPTYFETRKTCYTCPPRLKRKTKYPCKLCQKPICLECASKVCAKCLDRNN